ncbi:hypothetical protein EDD29_4966 [Actinocorallia herbida]|uniref:Uncharacterized protein n=1 Tax=Actinocorallia herbida TaxID=58109 RepID=A0A3N1D1G2_9ACTN|nr:hypothetical protein [Actinocorallia herbida]ROO87364.1 hypothetical protein EDD29_4966 [Actinocorallia herbida]
MTMPRADSVPSKVTRFLLLSELCRRLGEHGCTSYLVNPASGGAVLRVSVAGAGGGWLAVAAVERPEGWAYAWAGRWGPAQQCERIARHLARAVAA